MTEEVVNNEKVDEVLKEEKSDKVTKKITKKVTKKVTKKKSRRRNASNRLNVDQKPTIKIGKVKVIATRSGYYGDLVLEAGSQFYVKSHEIDHMEEAHPDCRWFKRYELPSKKLEDDWLEDDVDPTETVNEEVV